VTEEEDNKKMKEEQERRRQYLENLEILAQDLLLYV
jgi:hypothetical protein